MSHFIHIGASGATIPAPACIIETETTHTLTTSTTTSAIILASEMGPNLPQLPINAGDIGLTVGSLEEPVTSVHVPSYKSSKAFSKESSKTVGYANCFGLPYQDHNYGAPPPPTPPQSPKPNDPSVDDDTSFSIISTTSTTNEEDLPHQGESITRCICGFNHDDEYMICCDKCLAWQHVDCMGLDRNNMPDVYMCERCAPRKVDKQKAKSLQARKREKMTAESSSDDSGEDNGLKLGGQHRGGRRGVRTKKNHIDKSGHNDGIRSAKKLRSIKKEKDMKKTKPRRRTKSRSDASNTVDEEAQDAWVYSFSESGDKYEEASCNQYTPEVQMLLGSLKLNGQHDEHAKKISDILDVRLCRMGAVPGGKGLITLQDIGGHQPITEYRGKVLLVSQFRQQNPIFNKRCYPYVLFYKIYPTGEEVCIDAREFGNEARFVRRSCTPNALIRHIIQNGSLRIFLFSCCEIKRGHEVTIPFDFNYKDCISEIDCACVSDECRIATLHNKIALKEVQIDPPHRRRRTSKKSSVEDDSSQSSITNAPTTPITPTTPTKGMSSLPVKSETINPDDGCEISSTTPLELAVESQEEQHPSEAQANQNQEDNNDKETEKQSADRRKKMTREERKIDAYMRAFERMEKLAKRREAMASHKAQQKQAMDSERNQPHEESRVKEEDKAPSQTTSNSTGTEKNGSCTNNTQQSSLGNCIQNTEITNASLVIKEENKQIVRQKKGKRRRGSGTIARRRNRTSSGGSDLLSPDENPLSILCNTAAAMAMASQNMSSGGSVSGSSPGTPIPNHPLNGTTINMVINNTLCGNNNAVPEPTSTPPPPILNSTPATGSPDCIIPKSKRYLMRGWLQEKAESSTVTPVPVSCPLSVRTENWTSLVSKPTPPCYIRCTKEAASQGGISASHLRRNSASGGRSTTSLGSAKKRWLRQAMGESTDGSEPHLHQLGPEDLENGHCSPMHNGCASPGPNYNDVCSPSSISPPGDIVTPLKKRRLMRESLDSTSPGMLSPSSVMDRPASASSSSASPEHNSSYPQVTTLGEALLEPINDKMNNHALKICPDNGEDAKNLSTLPSCVKLVVRANNLDPIEVSKEGPQRLENLSSKVRVDSVVNTSKVVDSESAHCKTEVTNPPGDSDEGRNTIEIEKLIENFDNGVCDKNHFVTKQAVAPLNEKSSVALDSSDLRTKQAGQSIVLTKDAGFLKTDLSTDHSVNNVVNSMSATLPFVQKDDLLSLQEKRSDLEELLPIASALLEIQTVAETVVVSENAKFNIPCSAEDINSVATCSLISEISSATVSVMQNCQNNCDMQQVENVVLDQHIWISSSEAMHSEEIGHDCETVKSTLGWNEYDSTTPSLPLVESLPSPSSLSVASHQILSSPSTACAKATGPLDSHHTISAKQSPIVSSNFPKNDSHCLEKPMVSTSPTSFSVPTPMVEIELPSKTIPSTLQTGLNSPLVQLGPTQTFHLAVKNNLYHNATSTTEQLTSCMETNQSEVLSPQKGETLSPISHKRPHSPPTTPPSGGGSNVVSSSSSAPKRKVSLSEYRMRMKENVVKTGNNSIIDSGDVVKSPSKKDKLSLSPSFSSQLLSSSSFSISENSISLAKRPSSLSLGQSSVHNNISNIKKTVKDIENAKHLHIYAKSSEKLKRETRFDEFDKSLHSGSTNHKLNHSTSGSLLHPLKAGKSPPSSSKLYVTQGSSKHPLPPPPPPPPPVGLPIPVLCSSVMVSPSPPAPVISAPIPKPPPIPHPHQILSHHSSMILAVPPTVTSLAPNLRLQPGSGTSNQSSSPSKLPGKNLIQIPKQPGNHFIHLAQPPPPPPPRQVASVPGMIVPLSLKPVTQGSIVAINTVVPPSVGAMVHKLATLPPPPPPPPPPQFPKNPAPSVILNYKESRPQSKT